MNWQPERRRWLGALALAAVAALLAAHAPRAVAKDAQGVGLQPFKARYQATFRGISGGQIENGLRPGAQPGQWLYETRAYPNLLGRIAVSPEARERGVMEVTAAGVRPLSFDFSDGKSDLAKDVRFAFDWGAGRVKGEAQGVPFDLPVAPGTQDTASVQAAMIVELLAGRQPKGFTILTGRRLRDYRYWSEGRATVVTPFGQFETVVWANQRDGSDRVVKVWHAPALGYVPVQAVQFRKGQLETQLKLVNFQRL
jgi:Protein of unknown function (DUF3108)